MRAQPPVPARGGPAGPAEVAAGGRWADAGLVSGEAVELDVRAARLGSRVLALLIDIVGQLLCAALLALTLTPVVLILLPDPVVDRAFTGALETLGLVLVLVGYPVAWERLNHGRTPGKLAVGLRVVSADGGPVELRQSLTRVFVAAGVGLRTAWAWISPPEHLGRGRSVAEAGRSAILVAVGLVGLFAVSALLEAFVTPSPVPVALRVGLGATVWLGFLAYVVLLGRRAVAAERAPAERADPWLAELWPSTDPARAWHPTHRPH